MATVVAGCALASAPLLAQPYPSQRIQLVIPYSPANGLDLLGREYADALQKQLGVAVPVENREGAAGLIGTSFVARAPADGYTLLFTANPPFVTSPLSLKKPPYNPLTGFVPLTRVGSVPLVLITATGSPVKSFEDLKRYTAQHPEKANYASAGVGSPGQVFGELMGLHAGMSLKEIPYKSTTQGLTDVISGNVLVSLVSVTAASQHIAGGSLRLLAVGSQKRLPGYAAVPTLAEVLGQPDFEASVWYGFLAPAGTPREVVGKLEAAIEKVSTSTRMVDFMARSNIISDLQASEKFARSLKQDALTSSNLVAKTKSKNSMP